MRLNDTFDKNIENLVLSKINILILQVVLFNKLNYTYRKINKIQPSKMKTIPARLILTMNHFRPRSMFIPN